MLAWFLLPAIASAFELSHSYAPPGPARLGKMWGSSAAGGPMPASWGHRDRGMDLPTLRHSGLSLGYRRFTGPEKVGMATLWAGTLALRQSVCRLRGDLLFTVLLAEFLFLREWLCRPTLVPFNRFPPTEVSHFDNVTAGGDDLVVHSTRVVGGSARKVHLFHGFGASALSFNPVAKRLARLLKAQVVAHDRVGFGFTERPAAHRRKGMVYSTSYDVAIARALLSGRTHASLRVQTGPEDARVKTVIIGHSMGAAAAMGLATTLDQPPSSIVLVLISPAIFPRDERTRPPLTHWRRAASAVLISPWKLVSRAVFSLTSVFLPLVLRSGPPPAGPPPPNAFRQLACKELHC